jgi:hypothetical protein
METKRYQVEVDFFEDDADMWNGVWAATGKTYATQQSAERAANAHEIKLASRGCTVRTRVISYPVSK